MRFIAKNPKKMRRLFLNIIPSSLILLSFCGHAATLNCTATLKSLGAKKIREHLVDDQSFEAKFPLVKTERERMGIPPPSPLFHGLHAPITKASRQWGEYIPREVNLDSTGLVTVYSGINGVKPRDFVPNHADTIGRFVVPFSGHYALTGHANRVGNATLLRLRVPAFLMEINDRGEGYYIRSDKLQEFGLTFEDIIDSYGHYNPETRKHEWLTP